MNAIGGTLLPKFEGFILILHVLGFSAVLIPLIILGDHQDPSEVFGHFLNSNWPTQGLSFMVGITGSLFVFVGMPVHPYLVTVITHPEEDANGI